MALGFPIGCMGPMSPWASGGISVHVAELTRVLARDHPVRIVTPGPKGGRFRDGNAETRVVRQFPVRPLPPFEFLPEFSASIRFLRGVSILHAHDPRLATVAKFLRTPLVTTFHGYLTFEAIANSRTRPGRPLFEVYDRLVRAAVETSEGLIAVDGRIAEWLRREYGTRRVEVVPNGVDTVRYRPRLDGAEFRRALGIPGEAPLILAAKHFVPKNGMDVIVRAMPRVCREVPEAQLLLAGHGELEPMIRRLVDDLGLRQCVHMPGQLPHDRMPLALAACDLCVVPSVPVAGVEEATSVLALEAMASGKPVVASNLGGLREIIADGDTGVLVSPGDPVALGASIAELLQDDRRRRDLGERARSYVVAHHSWESVAQKVGAVYERLLGRGPIRSESV